MGEVMKKYLLFILSLVLLLSLFSFVGCNSCEDIHVHKFTTSVVDATCTTAGEKVYICDCGDTYTREIQPLGHTYENSNECSVCGYVDTQYFTFAFSSMDTYSIRAADENNVPAHVVIPSKIDGYRVTAIADQAFCYCSSLKSVVIPDSVTTISPYAFYYCSSLKSVVIPDGVTSIGYSAFYNCRSLTSVVIPDSVTYIGYHAFYNCSSLTSVVIPDGVTTIDFRTFYSCDSLTSVVIPDSVTSIGFGAFSGCSGLTSIKYHGTQTKWGKINKDFEWDFNTGNYTITYNYTGE